MMKGKFVICIGIIVILLNVLVIAEEGVVQIESGGNVKLYNGELNLSFCIGKGLTVSYDDFSTTNSKFMEQGYEETIGKYRITTVFRSNFGPYIYCISPQGAADFDCCEPGYIKVKVELLYYCGDNICNEEEDCNTCLQDCKVCEGFCGDNICNGNENCKTCSDCGSCKPYCGDGVCQDFETCNSCVDDCGQCPTVCGDGKCSYDEPTTCPEDCDPSLYSPSESGGGGGSASDNFCGDNVCNANEDYQSCPNDCERPIICGDSICDADEDCCIDCGCEDNFECVANECIVISQSTQSKESHESLIPNLTVSEKSELEKVDPTTDTKEENTQIQTQEKINIIQVVVSWFKRWFR